jgi:hypothetical protein
VTEIDSTFDASNVFLLGVRGDYVNVGLPPRGEMTKKQALLLAAWLVVISGDDMTAFAKVLNAVRGA